MAHRRLSLVAGAIFGICCWPPAIAQSAAAPDEQGEVHTVTITTGMPAQAPGDELVGRGADAPDVDAALDRRMRARRLARSPLRVEEKFSARGEVDFVVRNLLHAPLTVRVARGFTENADVTMFSPAHFTVPPLGRVDVARVTALSPIVTGRSEFRYAAVIGDPAAVADARVVYRWPFPVGVDARLSQGFHGPTHNEGYSDYAIDLAVPEGTPVLAARAGVVVYLEDRYFESGLDPAKFRDRANAVRILHDDGSMATYAHLYPKSIDLEPGQRVEAGEQIGLSGNTGYSSGPHLHFVLQVHRDMKLVAVPFRMERLELPLERFMPAPEVLASAPATGTAPVSGDPAPNR